MLHLLLIKTHNITLICFQDSAFEADILNKSDLTFSELAPFQTLANAYKAG